MKILLIISLIATALLKRLLFWLAVVQQKEYRFDRLKSYLIIEDGKKELWNLLPHLSWLKVKFWKRPSWTGRIIFITAAWMLIVGSLFGGLFWLMQMWAGNSFWLDLFVLVGFFLVVYILIPVILVLAILPSVVISMWATYRVSRQVQTLINKRRPLIIGITGSYGKTSTKQILAHVLAAKYSVFATPNSFNTRFSVAKSIVDGYQDEEVAIIEYGAYATHEIAQLCQIIQPQLAAITGITKQHLGIFGSLDSIIAAKSELVQALPADGVVFYNGADALTEKVAANFPGIKYSYNDSRNHQVQSAGLTSQGKLELVLDSLVVKTNLIGLHYVSCIEAALLIGEHLGVPRSQIIAKLISFQPTLNFTRIFDLNQEKLLLDDGLTSNPVGFKAMLDLSRSIAGQPKILIFGGIVDLGDQSTDIHQELARLSLEVFDQVWYCHEIGQIEFSRLKKDWVVSNRKQILDNLSQLPPKSLLVIEGKLPVWLMTAIKQLKEQK